MNVFLLLMYMYCFTLYPAYSRLGLFPEFFGTQRRAFALVPVSRNENINK